MGGTYDTTGGYYGMLWEIKTSGTTTLQDTKYTWDAGGNMNTRQDVLESQTESFTYDTLDRLIGVSGPYTHTYSYDSIGNITAMNDIQYTYGDSNHKHAVTQAGTISYVYDANGNMTARGGQTIEWDIENRPVSISTGGGGGVYGLAFDGNDTVSISGSALKVGESQGSSASYEFWIKLSSPGTFF